MKITIEIDPATLSAVVTGAMPAEARSGPVMIVDAAAQSAALDAGACSGLPGERTTFTPASDEVPAGTMSAGMPPVHHDTFGLRIGDQPGNNGRSAGSPLGGAEL